MAARIGTVSYTHLDVYKRQAQRYLDSGDYYWNSGMFMFRASAFLAELERLAPAMLAACQQALSAGRAVSYTHLDGYKRQEYRCSCQ